MLKYKLKTWASILIIVLFLTCLILTLLRWIELTDYDFRIIDEMLSIHLSNFILSMEFCLLIGLIILCSGKSFTWCVVTGFIVIGMNFLYENFFELFNTRDPVDALYGLLGVLVSLVCLLIIKYWGLKAKE